MNINKNTLTIVAVAALVSVPVVVFHRTNTDEKTIPAAAPAKSPPSPPSSGQQTAKARARVAEPPHYRPAPGSKDVRRKVDAIVARHRGMTQWQLLQDEEIQHFLASFASRVDLNSPEMRRKMDERVQAIQAVTGVEHGVLDMNFGEPDSPKFRAFLEAGLSDDPQGVQEWFFKSLDGAIFEFAFDPALERSSDGVSIRPFTKPADPSPSGGKSAEHP